MKDNNKIYNKFLVLFMEGKAKRLKQSGCRIHYFNKKLEEHMMNWDSKTAKRIYQQIKNHRNKEGLSARTCPFCHYHKNDDDYCFKCYYGKLKGMCNFSDSTWERIRDYYAKIGNKSLFAIGSTEVANDFSNEFYKKLIKKIEKKLNIKEDTHENCAV